MKSLSDIYFYNATALAQELNYYSVSEPRAIKHLIATVILSGVGFTVPISVDFNGTVPHVGSLFVYIIMFLITSVITYYGLWMTYQANAKGDGKDYFLRLVSLSLPIGIQLVVLFLIIGMFLVIAGYILAAALGEWGVYISHFVFYVAIVAFTVIFFLRMRQYIYIAAGVSN